MMESLFRPNVAGILSQKAAAQFSLSDTIQPLIMSALSPYCLVTQWPSLAGSQPSHLTLHHAASQIKPSFCSNNL